MTTIDITGVIGWDTDLAALRAAFDTAEGDVTVRLHSPGGEVFDGIAIHNLIRDAKRRKCTVTAQVTGLAASMATYIAAAADHVEVEDNAVWMVHNPWTLALGDHRDMQKATDTLSGLTRVLASAYSARTGKPLDTIRAEMDAETWLYGSDIVAAGYADALIPAGDGPDDAESAFAKARTAFGAMRHTLKQRADAASLDRIAALLPPNPPEPLMANPEPAASVPAPQPDPVPTEPTASEAAPTPAPTPAPESAPEPVDVEGRVKAALAAERTRIADITALCVKHDVAALADELIRADCTIEQAGLRILDALAARSGPEIRQTTSAAPSGADPLEAAVAAYQAAHPGTARPQAFAAVIQANPSLYDAHCAARGV